MIFQFTCRTHCDLEETREIRVGGSAAAFGDVGWDRARGAANLTGQSIKFVAGKVRRRLVHCQGQLMGFLPDLEVVEGAHSFSSFQLSALSYQLGFGQLFKVRCASSTVLSAIHSIPLAES